MRAGKGFRARTRKKFRKPHRSKFTVERYLREFHPRQRVMIDMEPSSTRNMPHYRYKGKTGTVVRKRGQAYVVRLMMGDKEKTLMLKSEHLKPAK